MVVGAIDPNPKHRGRGLEILAQAGVRVESGVLAEECQDLNLIFNHNQITGRPLLAGKAATTLDGKVQPVAALPNGLPALLRARM